MQRLLVALALVGLASSLEARAQQPGVERWAVKTSIVSNAPREAVALPVLLALPDPPDAANRSHAHQSVRYSAGPKAHGLAEGDLVTTKGWIHLVAAEPDGDYHIQMSRSAASGDDCIVIEVPRDDPAFVRSAAVRATSRTVREFIRSRLLRGAEPSSRGSIMIHPVFVEVTGQLFFDDPHLGDAPRGKKGMHAATLWELHPVTAIRFAPKPR